MDAPRTLGWRRLDRAGLADGLVARVGRQHVVLLPRPQRRRDVKQVAAVQHAHAARQGTQHRHMDVQSTADARHHVEAGRRHAGAMQGNFLERWRRVRANERKLESVLAAGGEADGVKAVLSQ